jgi:lipopolysaccharide transport system ATP-binding protein
MRRIEIDRRFDEIVAFAEIERFLDTPVKRYSSGMYVRLAFAVAAHLEPEILLVDEVLAVGDIQFQAKCLGKMEDAARAGRTVLFVSHNMAAIQHLCERVILLRAGEIHLAGSPDRVTACYMEDGTRLTQRWERTSPSDSEVILRRIELQDHSGRSISHVTTATRLAVAVDFTVVRPVRNLQLTVGLNGPAGEPIFDASPQDAGVELPDGPGDFHATVRLPADILLPQRYRVKVGFWQLHGGIIDTSIDLSFVVQEVPSLANVRPGGRSGLLVLPSQWTIRSEK